MSNFSNRNDTASFNPTSVSSDTHATASQTSQSGAGIADEAKNAVSDLTDKAKQGFSDATAHVKDLAEEKKAAGADRFKSVAAAVSRAADALDDDVPQAAAFVRRAASGIDELADAVKERDVSDLVGVVHDYARRQPTVFLGATALIGFAAVRFFMTSAERSKTRPSFERSAPVRSGYGAFERATGGPDSDELPRSTQQGSVL